MNGSGRRGGNERVVPVQSPKGVCFGNSVPRYFTQFPEEWKHRKKTDGPRDTAPAPKTNGEGYKPLAVQSADMLSGMLYALRRLNKNAEGSTMQARLTKLDGSGTA